MKRNGNGPIEILIAEDSPTQAEQLRQLLEDNKFRVSTAPNGKAALAILAQRQPALVISDVVMPELDGYGLCKAIKADDALKHIPVMLVTTLSDPDDVIRGLECGADNFIRKPYDEKYLLSRIEYLLMNVELRKNQRMQMALEINLAGNRHFITAERQQILDLLVSTYEQAIQINSELKEREKDLARSNQILQGLNHIAEGLNSAVSEREVMETALERALTLPGIEAGWIFLAEEDGFRLAASRNVPPALDLPHAFEGSCDCQHKLQNGELKSTNNIIQCERLSRARGDKRGLCCHASVPLWLGAGRPLGVMNLAGPGKGLFNEQQLHVLHGVGNQVAVALERARLHGNLETLVQQRTATLAAEVEERKRIERKQARLVAIIEATPDFVGTADINGQPIYFNRAAMKILGLVPNQAVPAMHLQDTHPAWAARRVMEEGIPHAIEHGTWSGETALLRKDGTEIPVLQSIVAHKGEDGKVSYLSTIMRDIGERVQAEHNLHEALATLDASDDAAYIFDPDTLRFSYVSDGAVRALGYSRMEFLQMTPLAFKPGFSEAHFREMLAPMIRGEVRNFRYTTLNRHKDGHDIPVEVSFQYVAPPGEKPRFIAIARDVTEQQNHLRQLQRAATELEVANAALESERSHLAERVTERTTELTIANQALEQAKIVAEEASRAKSAFLATMSHEIRTPMNGVIGMVDVLAQTRLSEHQADLVRTVRESANTLLGIIDDILDFSKIEAGRMELEHEPVSITDLAEGLCSSLLPVAMHKAVDIGLFISPVIPEHVLADDMRLRQLLYNLLGNAIKFSAGRPGKRGRVSLRVVIDQATPLRLSISVADNGIGMAPETVAGLFTPFTQAEVSTTRRYGGTGLGLTICKRLVDLMHGEIAVESQLGKGSTFTITLPFDVPAEQPARAVPDLSELDCIVLESRDIPAEDLCAYLEHAGARVRILEDAAAAAGIAAKLTVPVVVILEVEQRAGASAQPPFALPNVRHLLIMRGRRRRARVEDANTVTLDGTALRRTALLRAVAVAAGRASPEVFHERSTAFPDSHERTVPAIAEARAKGRLILVAEDDEINQKVILEQLSLLGHAAEIASNGIEALRMWREGHYALLLTDLHMPEMDGYSLAEAIRRDEGGRSHIPILALTANALRGEASRARAAGMDEYLTKPVQLSTLRSMLEKWLTQSMPPTATNEPATATKTRKARTSAVDITVLENLVGSDPATLAELLGDYLASAERLTQELHAALASGDAPRIGAIAHKLKSSSRSVGALTLGDLCAEMENAGKTGDKATIARRMAKFDGVMTKVETDIRKFLKRLNNNKRNQNDQDAINRR